LLETNFVNSSTAILLLTSAKASISAYWQLPCAADSALIPVADLNVPEVGDSADLSAITFGYANTKPKRRGAFAEVTQQIQIQNPEIIEFINDQVTKKIVSQVEKDFFTGILADASINNLGVGLTHDKLNQMEASVSIENQLTDGLGYLVNPKSMGAIKKLEAVGGTLLYSNGKLNDLPILMTNSIPEGVLFFGKFNSAVISQFDQVNVIVDTYTKAVAGQNRLIFNGFFDHSYILGSDFAKLAI
jgi:HK97 family phage major capsid protein